MRQHPRVIFAAIGHMGFPGPAGSLEVDRRPKHREKACLSTAGLDMNHIISLISHVISGVWSHMIC